MKRLGNSVLLLILLSVAVMADTPDTLPIAEGHVSSPFGFREEGYGGQAGFHKGVDFSAPVGTEVVATMSGRVIEHWPPPNGHYRGHDIFGGCITIAGDDGWVTFYAHLSRSFVREGEWIEKGQVIGEVGSTGWSTGPHLHYEVWIDPMKLIEGEENENTVSTVQVPNPYGLERERSGVPVHILQLQD